MWSHWGFSFISVILTDQLIPDLWMHYHLLIVILNIKKKSVPTIDPFSFCLLYFEILCYFESFLKYERYKFFQNRQVDGIPYAINYSFFLLNLPVFSLVPLSICTHSRIVDLKISLTSHLLWLMLQNSYYHVMTSKSALTCLLSPRLA